jgi:hypothetical protein
MPEKEKKAYPQITQITQISFEIMLACSSKFKTYELTLPKPVLLLF